MGSIVKLDVKRSNVPFNFNTMKITHQFNTKTFGIGILIYAAILGVGTQVAIHFLDKATAEQCITHDWPKEADQVHRDWCIGNGYQI